MSEAALGLHSRTPGGPEGSGAEGGLARGPRDGGSCDVSDLDGGSSVPDAAYHRHSSMDHLDVGFREWYSNYRRRSSNLSDLSSRRSSYDLTSRRSSNCSARGYSSEFSSEFEEYYDNFQSQERHKYHTIKEEVGSSVVLEFASNLAASLLQVCTQEASALCPSPRDFKNNLPHDQGYEKPTPIKLSPSSTNGQFFPGSDFNDFDKENGCVNGMSGEEKHIRKFVDAMFEEMWPFSQESDTDVRHFGEQSDVQNEITNMCCLYKHNMKDNQNISAESLDNQPYDSQDISLRYGRSYSQYCDDQKLDEEVLLAVADRIVSKAFQEALLEFRYLSAKNIRRNMSESSLSDHSMEEKDQLDSSMQESINRSNSISKCDRKNVSPAMKVAERMMSGLFSQKIPHSLSSSKASDASRLISQEMAIANDAVDPNFPKQAQICDTNIKVVIDSVPTKHSSVTSDKLSQSKLDMYNRLADRILQGGFNFTSEAPSSTIAQSVVSIGSSQVSHPITTTSDYDRVPSHGSHTVQSSQPEIDSAQESCASRNRTSSNSSSHSSSARKAIREQIKQEIVSQKDRDNQMAGASGSRSKPENVVSQCPEPHSVSSTPNYELLGARPKVRPGQPPIVQLVPSVEPPPPFIQGFMSDKPDTSAAMNTSNSAVKSDKASTTLMNTSTSGYISDKTSGSVTKHTSTSGVQSSTPSEGAPINTSTSDSSDTSSNSYRLPSSSPDTSSSDNSGQHPHPHQTIKASRTAASQASHSPVSGW